jgi:hypothetical protein
MWALSLLDTLKNDNTSELYLDFVDKYGFIPFEDWLFQHESGINP